MNFFTHFLLLSKVLVKGGCAVVVGLSGHRAVASALVGILSLLAVVVGAGWSLLPARALSPKSLE